MGKEILIVPEEHLADVIYVIRAGLNEVTDIAEEVYDQLQAWCKDEEEYLESLSENDDES